MASFTNFLLGSYILVCISCCFTIVEALVGVTIRSVEENEFPFIVAIAKYYQEDRPIRYFCAGSLISRKDVLTSAHCLITQQINGIQILVGSPHLDSCRRYDPLWWLTFDQWAERNNQEIPDTVNDVAFLNLIISVEDNIVPAQVTISEAELLYGTEAQIAGWGKLQNNSVPNTLQTGTVNIISKTECEDIMSTISGELIEGDERAVCSVADPYVLLRPGDSGGPLFYGNTLLALNFGTCPFPASEIHPQQVNLHVLITPYYNFIEDLLNNP